MKALAANCSKSATIKKYDQLSVAQHQLEGAIANLFLGNWPSAITLAGAAEEVLPEHANFKDLMSIAKDDVAKQHGVTSKQISDIMNKKRNWLKHDKSNDPNSEMIVDFSQEDAIIMIIRALTKVMAHHAPFAKDEVLSEHILVFDDWCKRNYPEFSVP
ncbi:MAG: hypothetical protein ABJA10_08120, partial [Aestuariivirga sp.]